MKKMEGKVVLITGGARGIGYGIAKAFAEEGANIVITGRTASTLIEARAVSYTHLTLPTNSRV